MMHTPVVKQMIRHVLAVSQKLGLVDKPSETVVAVPAARRRAKIRAVVRGSSRKMAVGRWIRSATRSRLG